MYKGSIDTAQDVQAEFDNFMCLLFQKQINILVKSATSVKEPKLADIGDSEHWKSISCTMMIQAGNQDAMWTL